MWDKQLSTTVRSVLVRPHAITRTAAHLAYYFTNHLRLRISTTYSIATFTYNEYLLRNKAHPVAALSCGTSHHLITPMSNERGDTLELRYGHRTASLPRTISYDVRAWILGSVNPPHTFHYQLTTCRLPSVFHSRTRNTGFENCSGLVTMLTYRSTAHGRIGLEATTELVRTRGMP